MKKILKALIRRIFGSRYDEYPVKYKNPSGKIKVTSFDYYANAYYFSLNDTRRFTTDQLREIIEKAINDARKI